MVERVCRIEVTPLPAATEKIVTLEHPGQQSIRCFGGTRCFMRTNRTPDEWADWCIAKNRIAEELKEYYSACTTRELAPQLLALSKKLDEELLKKQEHSAVA